MRVLWSSGEASSVAITSAIVDPPLSRNTVMSTLGVLERKGYVTHRTEGRTFVYAASVGREDARTGALRHLVSRFFDGSTQQLVLKLLDDAPLAQKDRAKIERLLDEWDED